MFPLAARRDAGARSNTLMIDFDDPGRITTSFLVQEARPALRLSSAGMVFGYADSFNTTHALEGYERLLLDAMLRDQSQFTRSDGIERLWEASTPLLENRPPVELYAPGCSRGRTASGGSPPRTTGAFPCCR
ncbi:hypothetical protein PV392_05980 [Streptomyces sp. ME03-5709C]|nr:hypothetical protein [Streptomyces sp. ME03-5709C]